MNYYSPCPVETAINIIGNKWKLLIVRDLLSGTKRFGELKKSISATKNQVVSQNVLTQNLRELESAKIINRKIYATVPPKVEYSLTGLGESLEYVINALSAWGRECQSMQEARVSAQSLESSAQSLESSAPNLESNIKNLESSAQDS